MKDKGYQDGILELRADKTATLLDTAGKVRAAGHQQHGFLVLHSSDHPHTASLLELIDATVVASGQSSSKQTVDVSLSLRW